MSDEIPEADRQGDAPHPRMTIALRGQSGAEARFLETLGLGRLPHGWLITGPRGIGKATLAWHIARHLLAGAAGDSLAMDPGHPVFRQVAALAAPGLFLCRRPWDEKTKRLRTAITVDEVRALKSFFQMSATEGGFRVAIIDAADEMTPAAANALLKILEEPPERSVLLLVCHQPARLLPTLRSRCRELRCQPLAPAALAEALRDAGADPARAAAQSEQLGALAAGSVGGALRLLDADGLTLYDQIVTLLLRAPGMHRPSIIALADSCAGRDSVDRYDLVLELVRLALARLAHAAAGGGAPPVSEAEASLRDRLGQVPAQARLWAERLALITDRTGHARAVHLDPAQVILDTFLQIDAAAAEAGAYAA